MADSRQYTATVIVGAAADRPPSGRSTRLFVADDTKDLWFDEGLGLGWVSIGKGAFGEAFKGVEIAPGFGQKWMDRVQQTFITGIEMEVGVVGDSTVEGVGGWDYWPNKLNRLLGFSYAAGNMKWVTPANDAPAYGGFQHMDKAEWVKGANFAAIGSSSVKDMGIFGIGYECLTGGVAAGQTATWTRGNRGVAVIELIWVDVNTAGSVGWSYSTNGGGAWVDVPVTNPGAATLKRTTFAISNPTDIRVRAAKADATASRIPAILGLIAYGTTNDIVNNQVSLHNLGRSAQFFAQFDRSNSAGDPYAIPKLLTANGLAGGHGTLSICGPWTNDLVLGVTPTDYGTYCQNFVTKMAPFGDILFVGAPMQDARSELQQAALQAKMREVALSNGCAYLDMGQVWGTYAQSLASGYMNGLHQTQKGHTDMAHRIFRLLRTLS